MKRFVTIGLLSNMGEGRYGPYVLLDNGVNFHLKCKLCFPRIFLKPQLLQRSPTTLHGAKICLLRPELVHIIAAIVVDTFS